MHPLHPANLPPYDAELSRRAAERYAVLNAVKGRRARQSHGTCRRRALSVLFRHFAIDASPAGPRW